MTQTLSDTGTGDTYSEECGPEEASQLEALLDSLNDAKCRGILQTLRESSVALSAKEVAEAANYSLSTTYRKLDTLTEAGLLAERKDQGPDGRPRSKYAVVVDWIGVRIGGREPFEVTLFEDATRLCFANPGP